MSEIYLIQDRMLIESPVQDVHHNRSTVYYIQPRKGARYGAHLRKHWRDTLAAADIKLEELPEPIDKLLP